MLGYKQFVDSLNECIVAGKVVNGVIVIAKNRDRGFYPENRIVRDSVNGTEVVYIEDLHSGWKEGMNEHGLCIVNSRFSSSKEWQREPRNQYKIMPYDEETLKSLKSEKEEIILEILSKCQSVDQALNMALEMQLKGVTLMVDNLKKFAEVEITEDYGSKFKVWMTADAEDCTDISRDENDVMKYSISTPDWALVRTNHGVLIPDAGYQEKVGSTERASSEIRKVEAERYLMRVMTDPVEVIKVLSQQPYGKDSENNVFRTTKLHKTGGQIVMDPVSLTFYYMPTGETDKFKGVDSRTDTSKINIQIL